MITGGVILILLGLFFDVGILWTVGAALLIVGAALWIFGALGRAVRGRRHCW